MNLSQLIDKAICIGCGFCSAVCPEDAVEIEFDDKSGIYQAVFHSDRCTDCGLCVSVCPFTGTGGKEDVGGESGTFLSYSKNERLRLGGASGGVVSQILISVLKNDLADGVIIPGVSEDDPFTYQYKLCVTPEEIINSAGSLYTPVYTANLAGIIQSNPELRLAVVGLPCTIKGLTEYQKISEINNIKLKIGLFCGRMPNIYATKYLLHRLGIDHKSLNRINYRSEGWPGNIRVYHDDDYSEVPYRSNLGMKTLFSSSMFLPKACYFCDNALAPEADISVGDAWLKELKDDQEGFSLISVNSPRGKSILDKISVDLYLSNLSGDALYRAQNSIIRAKGAGYRHRGRTYLFFNRSLRPLIRIEDFGFRPEVFLREALFMPIFLMIKRMNVHRYYKRIPFSFFYFLKLIEKLWRP